jgi:ADP-heptose:LPS heptosyltransferase
MRLISLQKGEPEIDLDQCAFPIERPLLGVPDLEETAALMCSLDLVVTVDSMPAHLAGAMGLLVCALLVYVADWRWGRVDSTRTFWYPSMSLIRQAKPGDWGSVIDAVKEEITTRRAEHVSARTPFHAEAVSVKPRMLSLN